MLFRTERYSSRLLSAVATLAILAGCDGPLDYDLRGKAGGFSTTDAAQNITTDRPKPDDRGVISYPNYQVAVARRGDTLTDVATRVGLPADELARYNGIKPNDNLRDGEIIALPRRVSEPSAATGAVDIESLAGNAIDSAPDTSPVISTTLEPAQKPIPTVIPEAKAKPKPNPEPVRHKVVRGETAYTISRLYQVPVTSLAEWNGLGSDFSIREGQYLLIPVTGVRPPKNKSAEAAAAATKVTEPGSGTPTPTPPSAVTPLPDEKISAKAPEPPKVTVGEPSRSSNAAMSFPVSGKIIRAYSKGRNDGIDISAAAGSPVTAAADGTVIAITEDADQVPIVILRHKDNLLTVYANVDKISVKKDDKIKRGQKLAQLRPGDNAYVHFEVRDGLDSVNPMPYLE